MISLLTILSYISRDFWLAALLAHKEALVPSFSAALKAATLKRRIFLVHSQFRVAAPVAGSILY